MVKVGKHSPKDAPKKVTGLWIRARRLYDTSPEGSFRHWLGRFILDVVYGCFKDDAEAPFRKEQEEIDADEPKLELVEVKAEDSQESETDQRTAQEDATNGGLSESDSARLSRWQEKARNGGRPVPPKSIVLAGDASIEKHQPRATKSRWWPAIAAALVLLVIAGCVATRHRNEPPKAIAETTTTASVTTTPDGPNPDMVAAANATLKENGWKDGQYQLGDDVDESQDRSTAGDGAFTAKGIKSPAGMVAFLRSDEDGAKALKASIMAATDGTEEEVLDTRNWIAVQATIDFVYPSNTSLHGAKVVNAGRRDGRKGDIFLIFVSPSSHKAVAVRGACGNAQVVIPRPVTPAAPPPGPPGLTPKDASQDPAARGNAPEGGGRNDQPGPGTYRPPGDMVHPPATPRVNPSPPPAPSGPPAGSTRDPAPPPPPEPAAPPATDPAAGNSTPPGGGSI